MKLLEWDVQVAGMYSSYAHLCVYIYVHAVYAHMCVYLYLQLSALDLSHNQIGPRGAESEAKLPEWDVQVAYALALYAHIYH